LKTDINFKQLAKRTTDHRLKMRYLAVHHFLQGKNRTQIAEFIGVARGSVNTWITKYLNEGISGLQSKPNPGRPPRLTPLQEKEVEVFVMSNIESSQGGRLIAADIQQFIEKQFTVSYDLSGIYRLLKRLGFSWITSRSKHPKQSIEAQEAFKKVCPGNDPSHTF